MKIVAVILTSNDSRHLQRCLSSLRGVADAALVVDSYSTDDTTSIAREYRARVVQRDWDDFSSQFNWGLDQLKSDYDWVLHLDPGEYLTPELATEIRDRLPRLDASVHGVYAGRRLVFKGQSIRFGSGHSMRTLRLFRYKFGRCEGNGRDPQITVPGPTVEIRGDVIEENLNTLSWWINRQNKLASREAAERLLAKYQSAPAVTTEPSGAYSAAIKIKPRFPIGLGALGWFFYRYVLRGGFLDGRGGAAYHLLQGFWYRYLVDAKIAEGEAYIRSQGCDVYRAISSVLHLDLSEPEQPPAEEQQVAV